MKGERKLIVGAAVERAAGLVLTCAAPLLEEEGHALRAALTTDVDDPSRSIGRASGPLSPPTITQSIPLRSSVPRSSSSGSIDRNRIAAGVSCRRANARQAVLSIFDAHPEPDVFRSAIHRSSPGSSSPHSLVRAW